MAQLGFDSEYRDGDINAIHELNRSTRSQDLIYHHRRIVDFYTPHNDNREDNRNFVRGHHYSEYEERKYRDKRKTQVTFNNIKTSERAIIGLWLQNRYDVKFASRSPVNDDIAQVLQQLDQWESNQQQDDKLDIEIMRQAWCDGNSFQEVLMEVVKGKEPIMRTINQNAFGVYWDPDSNEIITRTDAKFVDRDTWMTYPQLMKAFPKLAEDIEYKLANRDRSDTGYENFEKYADRDHEYRNERNGNYRVTERFYKVPGKNHYAEVDGMRIDIDDEDLDKFREEYPGAEIETLEEDELWLAVACEDWSIEQYLFNGKYHNQPRDPRTGEIIWPIVEMVAESLGGEPQGFVDHEKGPNKVINSMMSNIVSSATHASAAAYLVDKTAFISEKEKLLFARHHSDSDRTFDVKKGRVNDAVAAVPKEGVNQDNNNALEFATSHLREVTSTPPALMGQEEKGSPSGILNQQRIEQGFVQLQPFMKNYRLFLEQRAKLRYYYWRTYYNGEKTFRIVNKDKPNMDPFVTINKMEAETDALGRFTGAIRKKNDINAAIYDINIEESVKSPSYRQKQLAIMSELAQTQWAQADPGLAAVLLEETLRLSDASPEIREALKKHSTLIQQAAMQTKQAEQVLTQTQTEGQQLQNMAQMQQIAQTEVEQTGLPVQPTGQPQTAMAGV